MGERERQERLVALLKENGGILLKVAGAYTRTAADCEELVQETIAQLWRSLPSYADRYRFSTGMYRVALNVAISSLRGDVRRRRHTVQAEEERLEVPAPEPDPAEERRAVLREAMERLDPFDRAARYLLLLAPLAFAPLLVVAAIGALGIDLWAHSGARAWLVANLVFGGAFLAAGLLLSRTLASRPWPSRLGRLLAGQTLVEAERALEASSRLAAGDDVG